MPLGAIEPGSRVAVLGMGLTFYDVVAALTSGRGGRYEEAAPGRLRYIPSGSEPAIAAGCRSGVPLPARGLNQKAPDWRYAPRLFTAERVKAMRNAGPLDFIADVWPWLDAEVQLVYYATAVRGQRGPAAERSFIDAATRCVLAQGPAAAGALAEQRANADGVPRLDLARLARPFAGREFASPREFTAELAGLLREDIRQAQLGNYHGPLKAALDVLRDVRGVIRLAVDFGGLTAASHRDDFLGWFTPLSSFLAAGPPLSRLRQAMALVEAGIVTVVGPGAAFAEDRASGQFRVSSPQVAGSELRCATLVDARVPATDIARDPAPLSRQLAKAGLWTAWVNRAGGEPFDTGGVAVTPAPPYRPVGSGSPAVSGLYVLGIPTEGPRWFTQVGSARPGPWTQFTADADAIAADILAHAPAGAPAPLMLAGNR
jgi:methylaspartate mutase epsilon subunit